MPIKNAMLGICNCFIDITDQVNVSLSIIVMYHYRLIVFSGNSVNGGWSAYGDWTECSAECDGGTQSRTRACDNPAPENGGAECSGDATESRECNTQSCVVLPPGLTDNR